MPNIMIQLLWIIVFCFLICETATSLTNTDKKNNTKEYKDANPNMNYTALDISNFPNYFWFILGLGTGVLVMLITHLKLYSKLWCPDNLILRRICSAFNYFWQHIVTWFRHFCLHVPRGDYYPQVVQSSEFDSRPCERDIEPTPDTSHVVQQPQHIESISRLPNPVLQVPQHASLMPQHASLMPQHTSLMPQHISLMPRSSQGTSLLSQNASLVTQPLSSMSPVSHVPRPMMPMSQSRQHTSLMLQAIFNRDRVHPIITSTASTSTASTTTTSTTVIETLPATTTTTSTILHNPEDFINSLFKC